MATPRKICLLLLAYVATVVGPGVKQRITRGAAAESAESVDHNVCRAVRSGGVKQRIERADGAYSVCAVSSQHSEPTEFRAGLKHHWSKGRAHFGGWEQPHGLLRVASGVGKTIHPWKS